MAWGMHMNTGAEAKDSLRKRAADELREFLIIAAYLYVCFTALAYFKAAICKHTGCRSRHSVSLYQGFNLRQVHERGARKFTSVNGIRRKLSFGPRSGG